MHVWVWPEKKLEPCLIYWRPAGPPGSILEVWIVLLFPFSLVVLSTLSKSSTKKTHSYRMLLSSVNFLRTPRTWSQVGKPGAGTYLPVTGKNLALIIACPSAIGLCNLRPKELGGIEGCIWLVYWSQYHGSPAKPLQGGLLTSRFRIQ